VAAAAVLLTDLAAATTLAPGISIDLSVPPPTMTAGNPEDLSLMLRNLVDNAVRYARHRVLVTAAAGPDGVVVEIADDGPGIPAGERERVFGRFVRLDASREQASGSAGLGLAIVREIDRARRHHHAHRGPGRQNPRRRHRERHRGRGSRNHDRCRIKSH
jgi:signal transduction histidine kinase